MLLAGSGKRYIQQVPVHHFQYFLVLACCVWNPFIISEYKKTQQKQQKQTTNKQEHTFWISNHCN